MSFLNPVVGGIFGGGGGGNVKSVNDIVRRFCAFYNSDSLFMSDNFIIQVADILAAAQAAQAAAVSFNGSFICFWSHPVDFYRPPPRKYSQVLLPRLDR